MTCDYSKIQILLKSLSLSYDSICKLSLSVMLNVSWKAWCFWLWQELKKCYYFCLSKSNLALNLHLFSSNRSSRNGNLCSFITQKAPREFLLSTLRALREKESNQTLSYLWSLKYFVLFTFAKSFLFVCCPYV